MCPYKKNVPGQKRDKQKQGKHKEKDDFEEDLDKKTVEAAKLGKEIWEVKQKEEPEDGENDEKQDENKEEDEDEEDKQEPQHYDPIKIGKVYNIFDDDDKKPTKEIKGFITDGKKGFKHTEPQFVDYSEDKELGEHMKELAVDDDEEEDKEEEDEPEVYNPNKGGKNTEHSKMLAKEDEKKKQETRNAQLEDDMRRLIVVKKRREEMKAKRLSERNAKDEERKAQEIKINLEQHQKKKK